MLNLEGPTPIADEMRRLRLEIEARDNGRGKNSVPAIPGWHSEERAAELLGEHIQTRRRKRQLGVGPRWIRHGRAVLYPDGAEAEYLAGLLKRAEAEREAAPVRPRGRPRKGPGGAAK
jgi:hypothetical protein